MIKRPTVNHGEHASKIAMDDPDQRLLSGDPADFGCLLRQHDRDLRGVVWSVVRDRDAVDVVIQMAYEKAFRSLGSFEARSAVKTWLHTICYRTAIDYLRYENRRRHLSLASIEQEPSNQSTADAAIAGIELEQALNYIDAESRSMLTMTAGLGLTFDEVAHITGVPRGTVASKVSRARTQLRKEMER